MGRGKLLLLVMLGTQCLQSQGREGNIGALLTIVLTESPGCVFILSTLVRNEVLVVIEVMWGNVLLIYNIHMYLYCLGIEYFLRYETSQSSTRSFLVGIPFVMEYKLLLSGSV